MIIKQITLKNAYTWVTLLLRTLKPVFFLFLSRIREDYESLPMNDRKKEKSHIVASRRDPHILKLVPLFKSAHYQTETEIVRSFKIIYP